MLKLHLGCGNKYIPGFTHIDIIKYPHVDLVTNVDNLSMIESNSVDLIYACHILEHFNKNNVIPTLIEWRRILKLGGRLRLSVPDFEVLTKLYVSGEVTLEKIHGPIMGGQTYLYNFHYTIFDYLKLKNMLISVGFEDKNISRWDWKKTEHTNVDDYSQAHLPHMDKENGTLISLNVEAIK